ncbi:MAG: type I restriction endonuclease subunit R, partial [Sphingobacteriales bacterium]
MDTPSFIEDHISQIPALQLLMKMGYKYLNPDEALAARGGRKSNVLLEGILKQQLDAINRISYKGKEFKFTEANINAGIVVLRDLPVQDGYLKANEAFYDLITLGKSFDQTVLNDKKSFSFRYIDWEHPENNIYHVTEEYEILRTGREDHYRPDIVLFINGIPVVTIECKSPKIKDPVDKAIEQHLRNQQEDGIRPLYLYSNIVLSLAVDGAKYGTTATAKEFWGTWKEVFRTQEQEQQYASELSVMKNTTLSTDERTLVFKERYRNVLQYFNKLEAEEQTITDQDKLLYSLCRPERAHRNRVLVLAARSARHL